MTRQWNTSRKCIECGAPVPRKVRRCPPCHARFLLSRPAYPRTEEHKRRMSEATTGKPKAYPSASTRPEVAERIRQAWTPEMKEAARLRGLKNSLDPAWRLKIAESVAGHLNPRWEDGRAVLPYSPGFSGKVRQLVRERDGNRCLKCGSTKNLCVHHSDFQKTNHDLANLVLLCRKCHTLEHIQQSRIHD